MPEIRSGRTGPDLNRRKKSPVKLMVGVAAVAIIAQVGVVTRFSDVALINGIRLLPTLSISSVIRNTEE